jgi:hypothetical protein
MKIIDRLDNTKTFIEISNGDVFRQEKAIFMKMEEISSEFSTHNAVNLSDGTTDYFYGSDKIHPLTAFLTID